jgi:hypothetical protein
MLLNKVILNFSQEELELIKSNSEKLMEDLSKSSESLESKANILFSLLVIIIGSCLGGFIDKYNSLGFDSLIIQEIGLVLFASILSLNKVYNVLKLKNHKMIGTKPEFHINYDGYENTNKIKEILKDTIVTYQIVIDKNIEVHQEKVNNMEKSLNFVMSGIFSSILYALLYILFKFLFLQ